MAELAHPVATEAAGEGVAVAETLQGRRIGLSYAGTGVAVFAVMGVAGLSMRLSQATVIHLSPTWFYRLMTLHGIGMLTATTMAMMGASWYALSPMLPLSYAQMKAAYATILVGATVVIGAVLLGGFAPGWTFLYPLPFSSVGQWSDRAAAAWFIGVVLVGVGFAIYCVDVLIGVEREYGTLRRALGIPFVFGHDDSPPPPTVIAATVIALNGLLSGAVGTTILVAEFDKTLDPSMQISPLVAKNLTYFFGHMFANMILYLAAAAVYVMVPRYCGRQWKTTRPLAIAWLGTLIFLVTAYGHHLYMDFVEPRWIQYVSEATSYMAALPVAVITIYTGVMLTWGSRYRWTLASSLLYIGFTGWAIGGVGAVLDSIIPFNFAFHNTDWVVAHFHTYLLLGVVMWMFSVVAHLLERRAQRTAPAGATWTALGLMLLGGYGLTGTWFVAGALGIPRRYAAQPIGTVRYSLVGALFAVLFAVGFLVLLGELVWLALQPTRWSADSRPTHTTALDPWARNDQITLRRYSPAALRPPLTTRAQFIAVATLAFVSLGAFLPAVVDYSETSVRSHHLDHTAMFLFGCLLGLTLGCMTKLPPSRRSPGGAALAVALLAPIGMMIAMTPSLYEPLERDPLHHALFHLGMVGFGLLTGAAASHLGRISGVAIVILAVGMGVMFAATAP